MLIAVMFSIELPCVWRGPPRFAASHSMSVDPGAPRGLVTARGGSLTGSAKIPPSHACDV